MRILLNADRTITFEAETDAYGDYINANDVMVHQLKVFPTTPLTTNNESLWAVFAKEDVITKEPKDWTYDILLTPKQEDGKTVFSTVIPKEVIKSPGTWKAQIFRRRYNTVTNRFFATQEASVVFTFTVEEGLPYDENNVVDKTTILNLYNMILDLYSQIKE